MKQLLLMVAMLIATTGFGQYWQNVPSGTTKKLLSISFGSTTTGYIGGVDSLLLKTTDGGQSWQSIPLTGVAFPPAADDIVDVDFISATTGYITITNHDFPYLRGAVYKTSDGGSSWAFSDGATMASYRTHFFSDGHGFIIGSAFFAGNTVCKINGGQPADYHSFSYDATLFNLCVDFYDEQTGVIGDSEGKIYRTFDGGVHWDTVQNSGTDTAIYGIRFLNDSTILAATVGVLIISHDRGLTWQTDVNSLTFDYPVAKAIIRSAKDSFVAAGTSQTNPDKGIIYWHNGGFNQRELTGQPLYDVAACTDSISYAVGDSGSIVTNRTVPVVGIHTPSLLQQQLNVFPNPNTGLFTTTLPMLHTVKVYDLTGRLVQSSDHPAFRHTLDISAQCAGSYFLDITAGAEKINSKVVLR